MKGLSPVEAQKLYVESLVQLLKEVTLLYMLYICCADASLYSLLIGIQTMNSLYL